MVKHRPLVQTYTAGNRAGELPTAYLPTYHVDLYRLLALAVRDSYVLDLADNLRPLANRFGLALCCLTEIPSDNRI